MPLILPGMQLSHFRLKEKIGAGSFGEVYRAEDVYLQRPVALKLLTFTESHSIQERFLQEARFCSSLVHPNIAIVYEAGWHESLPYLAMELVEGESLSRRIRDGRVTQTQALQYIQQILEALEEAHSHGIIHRDIKSSNIMITLKDKVKILDFGIARSLDQKSPQDGIETNGTIEFMSPEQARGEQPDARSDLFSAAIVFYHMLSGRLPFEQETRVQTYSSILHDEAAPLPQVSDPLNAILQKALSKQPEDRYESAQDFLNAIKRLGEISSSLRASIAGSISIAVLYFDQSGDDEESKYLRLGITEDIITDLSKITGIRVLSRHAVLKFRDRSIPLAAMAQELQVRYLLHGVVSKQKSKEEVEVHVSLFDNGSGSIVWDDHYSSSVNGIFDLQEKVAKSVCAALQLRLTEAERRSVGQRPTESLKAYEFYLKGRHHFSLQNIADNKIAEEFLLKALQSDPHYAAAIAALSEVYVQRFYSWFDRDRKWLQKAEEIILRAAAINDHLAEVHCTLGMLLYLRGEYGQAMDEIQKSIRLDPHYAVAHDHSGEIYLHTGEMDKAILAFHTEMRINPEVIYPYFYLVWIHSLLGDFAISRSVLEQAKKKHQGNPLLNVLQGTCASYSGALVEAEESLKKAISLSPSNSFATGRLAVVYAEMQDWPAAFALSEKAIEQIDPLDHHAAFDRGCVFALKGDRENSLYWLKRAIDLGWRCPYHYQNDHNLAFLRNDPDFMRMSAGILPT
jgi:serine/threonine protein kinase/Tfp pilus assembly protein PilF